MNGKITVHDKQGITTLTADFRKDGVDILFITKGCDVNYAYQSLDTCHQALYDKQFPASIFSHKVKEALNAIPN
jgi:hypothetical protein